MTDRESHYKETVVGFKKEGFPSAMEEPLNIGAARVEILLTENGNGLVFNQQMKNFLRSCMATTMQ